MKVLLSFFLLIACWFSINDGLNRFSLSRFVHEEREKGTKFFLLAGCFFGVFIWLWY